MDVEARLRAVQQENEMLRARIDQLEEALGVRLPTPVEWGLTGSEARVFGLFRARELVTRDAIMAVLYRDAGKDEPEQKITDVFICKIRRKLKPFAIEIKTVWGQGYALPADTRKLLKQEEAIAA